MNKILILAVVLLYIAISFQTIGILTSFESLAQGIAFASMLGIVETFLCAMIIRATTEKW